MAARAKAGKKNGSAPRPAPDRHPMTKEELLEYENVGLKLAMNLSENRRLNAQRRALEARMEARVGFPIQGWIVDLERGALVRPEG